MYTKKLLSAAAAVAVMSTGAMAFDTNTTRALLKYNEEANTVTVGTYTDALNSMNGRNPSNLLKAAPGALGDALIYPAFFSDHGWQSEFTVVNTSSTHAVVAKVVLYGRENSKELKDFNIYLSANDVFRATIKDGVITSTDGSTVVEGTDSYTQETGKTYNFYDNVTMASDATPFSTSLDEPAGYIAVYAMAETNTTALDGNATATTDAAMIAASKQVDLRYHGMHKELWQDYRHLLDQCRSENWRNGINGGIYTDDQDRVRIPVIDMGINACNEVQSAQDANSNDIADGNITFIPPSAVLAGSIRVSGDDSRGTRSMLLPATPLLNFSPGGTYKVAGVTQNPAAPEGNYSILWTEGEFASLADRYIDWNGTGTGMAEYNATAIRRDCFAEFNVTNVLYEFKNAENSMVIMTQPFKRTLVQLNAANTTSPQTVCAYKEVVRGTKPAGQAGGLVTNYGGFKMGASIYDDDENKFNPATGGFTVSPATTPTTLIPNEMSAFNPIPDTSGVTEGYAVLDLTRTASGSLGAIVTQMSATTVSDTVETNWIYNLVNY